MPDGSVDDRSHRLFGRQYRLALWAAIAAREPNEPFTNAELVRELNRTSGEVSKELKVLVDVGLVTEGVRSGTKPFLRSDSPFWDGALALYREWLGSPGEGEQGGEVVPIR
jgi:hypothetical protein